MKRKRSAITSIIIPDSITHIGTSAFELCRNITSLTLGNSVQEIGKYSFESVSIESLVIPASVTTIDKYAFARCKSLASVTFLGLPEAMSNAFEGSTSLSEIHYTGSISEWNSIAAGTNWDYGFNYYVVYCSDSELSKW